MEIFKEISNLARKCCHFFILLKIVCDTRTLLITVTTVHIVAGFFFRQTLLCIFKKNPPKNSRASQEKFILSSIEKKDLSPLQVCWKRKKSTHFVTTLHIHSWPPQRSTAPPTRYTNCSTFHSKQLYISIKWRIFVSAQNKNKSNSPVPPLSKK